MTTTSTPKRRWLRKSKQILETENFIMAAIDDLNTTIDAVSTAAATIEATVVQLRTQQGVPEAQVAAAVSKLQPVLDGLNAAINAPAS